MSRLMERAGISISKLSKVSDVISAEDLARGAWLAAVGKRIARHAEAKALVRGNLVVEVDDAVWQRQLFHLRHQILRTICKIVGQGIVSDLEFRVAREAPRHPPQPARSLDEADGIPDSSMRVVYKQTRKLSTG